MMPIPSRDLSVPSFAATIRRVTCGAGGLPLFFFFFMVFVGGRGVVYPPGPTEKVRSDLNNFEDIISYYRFKQNAFPPWSANLHENVFSAKTPGDRAILENLPTFVRANSGDLSVWTSRLADNSSFFADPFSPVKGQVYCYWSNDGLSIVWSAGPDRKYDLTMKNIAQACDPAKPYPTDLLVDCQYDPTNGATSSGDMFRVYYDEPAKLTLRKDAYLFTKNQPRR